MKAPARPCRKAFKQIFALPSVDLGPELSCALCRLAAIWASVDTDVKAPDLENKKAGDAYKRFRLSRTSIRDGCKRIGVKCFGMREISVVIQSFGARVFLERH